MAESLTLQQKCTTAESGDAEPIEDLTATASSDWSSGYDAPKGVDNAEGTYWAPHSSDTDISYTVDLGGEFSLSTGTIHWYTGYAGSGTVQYSSDGGNTFQDLADPYNGFGEEFTNISFDGVIATHVRYIISGEENHVPIIREVDFTGRQ